MQKFEILNSIALPLNLNDVDTDVIYPAQYLTSISRSGLGVNLFRRLKDAEPNSPLNNPQYQTAQILLVNKNFGCGSSREHAVWSLLDAGFRAIVGESFADIFSSNAAKNGLLLIPLPSSVIDLLHEQANKATLSININLPEQTLSCLDATYNFAYDPFRKHCLLNGLDDLDYLLNLKKEIAEFRDKQNSHRFFNTLDSVRETVR